MEIKPGTNASKYDDIKPPGATETNEIQPLKSLFSHIYKFLNSSKVYILIFSRGI